MSNRCISYNFKGKKCRSRIKDGWFCESHIPVNFTNNFECDVCCEIITDKRDITVFKCFHMCHKQCYDLWNNSLADNSSEKNSCPYCREIVIQKKPQKYIYLTTDYEIY